MPVISSKVSMKPKPQFAQATQDNIFPIRARPPPPLTSCTANPRQIPLNSDHSPPSHPRAILRQHRQRHGLPPEVARIEPPGARVTAAEPVLDCVGDHSR